MINLLIPLTATILFTIIAVADFLSNKVLFPDTEVENLPPKEIIDEELMTDVDRAMAEKSIVVLKNNLGENPIDELLSMNVNDRINAVGNIADELSRLYCLSIKCLKFTPFLDNSVSGQYIKNTETIQININYLRVNDREILFDLLLTLFHEMRHAVQWSMIQGNPVWEADDKRRQMLAANFAHYISAKKDVHGYRMQLVERDAVTFAAIIMAGVEPNETDSVL